MTDLKSEITVPLATSLKYSVSGGFEDANELILKAPSNKHRRHAIKLKQGFFQALKASADDSGNVKALDSDDDDEAGNKEVDDELTGDKVVAILIMSNIDYGKYIDTFRELLLNDICFVAEGVKLTTPLFDSLSLDDTDTLLGEYLANFLLSSLMEKIKAMSTT